MKLSFLFALLILTGCHPLFCTWDSGYAKVTEEPLRNKLIGVYRLSESSQDYLGNFNDWTITLELSHDGKYKFIDHSKRVVKKGKWSIYCSGTSECVMELEGITVEPFGEKNKEIAILITIGDGDACEGIVYEKVK